MLITDLLKITHFEIHTRQYAIGFILVTINDNDIRTVQNLFLNPIQKNH